MKFHSANRPFGRRVDQPAASPANDGLYYVVTDEGNIVEQSNGSAWVLVSDGSINTLRTADPSPLVNDTWWVVRSGVSPAMVVSLKVRIAGVTTTLATTTI